MKLTRATRTMTEQQYRGLQGYLNSSAIRDYIKSRMLFYRKYILQEQVREKTSESILLGNVIHSLIEKTFDDKYVLPMVVPPTGQVLDLTNNLYERTLKAAKRNENGDLVITQPFEVLMADAIYHTCHDYKGERVAFKGKDDSKIIALWEKDGKDYYDELLQNTEKTVVHESLLVKAERIVQVAYEHPFTRDIFAEQGDEEKEIHHEFPITFDLDEKIKGKILLDKIVIDQTNKEIFVYDWKTGWDNEGGFISSYLKKGYYLQQAFYRKGLLQWMKDNNMADYELHHMKYVALDTTGENSPLVYEVTNKDYLKALRGFATNNGYEYVGLDDIIEEIKWSIDNNIWTHSKQVQDKRGQLQLDINYL